MQIGDPSYIKCPKCGEPHEFYNGPFFVHVYDLTEWSDGETFQDLPSTKESELQKCAVCNHYFWFKQKKGGMTLEDYVQAADHFEKQYSTRTLVNALFRKSNRKRMLYIRLQILRRYNDLQRTHPLSTGPDRVPPSDKKDRIFIDNAKSLINLLNDLRSDNHFLHAELYRNIGEFEKSRNILTRVPDKALKEQLHHALDNNNRNVIVIKRHVKERE